MPQLSRRCRHRSGITLTEMLIVVGILVILAGLGLPALMRVRAAAQRDQCQDNLRELGLAVHAFHTAHSRIPPMYGTAPPAAGRGTVHYFLLPFIGEDELYRRSGGDVYGAAIHTLPVPLFQCAADTSYRHGVLDLDDPWGITNYAANYQAFGAPHLGDTEGNMQSRKRIPASFPQGTSNVIFFAEKYGRCGDFASLWGHGNWETNFMAMFAYGDESGSHGYSTGLLWGQPGKVGWTSVFQQSPNPWQTVCDPTRASALHSDGLLACLGDASVRTYKADVDPWVWWDACSAFRDPFSSREW